MILQWLPVGRRIILIVKVYGWANGWRLLGIGVLGLLWVFWIGLKENYFWSWFWMGSTGLWGRSPSNCPRSDDWVPTRSLDSCITRVSFTSDVWTARNRLILIKYLYNAGFVIKRIIMVFILSSTSRRSHSEVYNVIITDRAPLNILKCVNNSCVKRRKSCDALIGKHVIGDRYSKLVFPNLLHLSPKITLSCLNQLNILMTLRPI